MQLLQTLTTTNHSVLAHRTGHASLDNAFVLIEGAPAKRSERHEITGPIPLKPKAGLNGPPGLSPDAASGFAAWSSIMPRHPTLRFAQDGAPGRRRCPEDKLSPTMN